MFEKVKSALGPMPGIARVLVLAPVALLVAGCAQVGTNNITFWDIVWSMSIFFLWMMFIWMFVALFFDVIRRKDIGGVAKIIWIIVMFWLPFIGILAYIAMRPATAADGYGMGVGGQPVGYGAGTGSQVDEITRLNQLKASGAISDAEYQQLKKNIVA